MARKAAEKGRFPEGGVLSAPEITIRHAGTPAQMEFWQSQERFRAFVGGVGSGKTRAGCVEVLKQPPSRGMIIAPTYPMLRDSTQQSFLQIAGENLIKSWNRSEGVMMLHTGHEIFWRSADNPDSLRGPNLGFFWLDEGAMLATDEAWDILIGRLREPPGRGWVTTTPAGFNWLWRLFEREKRPDYKLIRCATQNNPFLPKDYIKSLEEKYTGAWALQELSGEFTEWVHSPCYPSFRRELVLKPGVRNRYRKDLPLIVCTDFNVAIMPWPVCQIQDGKPLVLCEITSMGAGIDAQIVLLKNEFPDHVGEIWIYGDASGKGRTAQTGKSDYDILEVALAKFGCPVVMYVPRANPAPRDRIAAVNRMLRGADGAAHIDIDEFRCPELCEDFLRVEWNSSGSTEQQFHDVRDERSKRSHASSALGYFLYREFGTDIEVAKKTKKYKPLKYGKLLGEAGLGRFLP
jgi:hypothetical protein